jgi:hypothetical protein
MKKKIFALAMVAILLSCSQSSTLEMRNRYFYGGEVVSLPNLQYDSDGSEPDLRIDLKRKSANFWEFSTLVRNNARRLPLFTSFPSEVLATDEVYEVRLMDEDLGELSDDEIFYWEFQAIEDGANGVIEFFDDQNTLRMTLEYEER